MENYIYTIKARAVVDIAKPQEYQDFYDSGRTVPLETLFSIDLTDPKDELSVVESFENAGDCAFFNQFRNVISEQKKKDIFDAGKYYHEEDKYLLKDKVVILNFENLFFSVDFEDSLRTRMRDEGIPGKFVTETDDDGNEEEMYQYGFEYLESSDPTFSQKIRHLFNFSKITIAFIRDKNNNPIYHTFVAFDKSQSMARNSRILLVSTDFLNPFFNTGNSVYSLNLSLNEEYKDVEKLNSKLDNMQTFDTDIYFHDGLDIERIKDYLPEIIEYSSKCKDIIYVKLPDKIKNYSGLMNIPRKVEIDLQITDEEDEVPEYSDFYPLFENEEQTYLYYVEKSIWQNIKGKTKEEKLRNLQKQYAEYQKLYLDKRLNLGIDFSYYANIGLGLSKFYAYRGLYLSTSKRIDGLNGLNQNTVVVIPDKPYGFKNNPKDYNFGEDGLDFARDFYYEKEVPCYTNTYKIIDGKIKAEPDIRSILLKNNIMFDGEGMICPDYADIIVKELNNKNANSFQIRMPFMKGVLHKVDFHAFLEDKNILQDYKGEYKIIDCFGIERDLKEAKIILTESMFKAAKWIENIWKIDFSFNTGEKYDDPMRFFFERFHEYKYALYVSGSDDLYQHGNLTSLNYQILNTLAIRKDELKQLAEIHWEHVSNPINSMLNAVEYRNNDEDDETGEDEEELSGTSWIDIIKLDEKFQCQAYVKKKIEAREKRLKRDLAYGRILLPGEIRYLSRDLMLMLKYLLELVYLYNNEKNFSANKELKEGIQFVHTYLLQEDCFYAPQRQSLSDDACANTIYENGKIYPLFRNPHLSRNEQVALKCICSSYKTIRDIYLGHLTGVLMVSGESFVPNTLGGADFDGDLVKDFDNSIISDAVLRGIRSDKDEVLPIIKINDTEEAGSTERISNEQRKYEKLPPVPFKNEIDYEVLYNTFANSVGKISNRAIKDGQRLFSDRFNTEVSECAIYTILTGLEIDACKSGMHPYLPPMVYTRFCPSILQKDFSYIDHFIKPLKEMNEKYPTIPSKKDICRKSDNELSWTYRKKVTIYLSDKDTEEYKSLSYLAYLFLLGCKEDSISGSVVTKEKLVKNGAFNSTFIIPDIIKDDVEACVEKYNMIKRFSADKQKQCYRTIYNVLKNKHSNYYDIKMTSGILRGVLPVKDHSPQNVIEEFDAAYEIFAKLQKSDWPYLHGKDIQREFKKLFCLKGSIPKELNILLDFKENGYHLLYLFLYYLLCSLKAEIKEQLLDEHKEDIGTYFAMKCKNELEQRLKECKNELEETEPFPYLYTVSNDKESNLKNNYGNGKLDLIWLCYSASEIMENIKKYTKYKG